MGEQGDKVPLQVSSINNNANVQHALVGIEMDWCYSFHFLTVVLVYIFVLLLLLLIATSPT